MDNVRIILDILSEETNHFWLAFLAGALGYLLTSIIYIVPFKIVSHFTHSPISTDAKRGMIIFCLLLSFAFVLLSHYGLDQWNAFYTTPLNPPLNIEL